AIRPLGLGGPAVVFNDAFIPLFHDRYRDRGVTVTSGSWHKWLGINGRKTFAHDGLHVTGLRERTAAELTQLAEGYRTPSPFTRSLLRHLGFRTAREYTERWVFGRDKRAFVRPVTPRSERAFHALPEWLARFARRGDRDALRVLDAYAADLVEGTRAVIRALRLGRGACDVILSGSVLTGTPALARAFRRRLRSVAPRARIMVARARPIRGALLYAAHHASWRFPPGKLRDPRLFYLKPVNQ
ncbi:MAG: hypothetical protein AAB368_15965, partial [bacterium]